jgi:hypothetical protein
MCKLPIPLTLEAPGRAIVMVASSWIIQKEPQAKRCTSESSKGAESVELLGQAAAAFRSCLEVYTTEAFPFAMSKRRGN